MADRQNREINEHESHPVATHPDRSINAYYPGYPTPYGADIEDEDGFDFWATVYMLWRRKWLMLAIVFVGVSASIILNLQTVPLYRAVTTIEIQEQEQQILEQGSLSATGNIDNEFMETQFALLRSFHPNYANSALTKPKTARTSAVQFRAQMAELVDALRSGRSVLLDVEVRVLFWAPSPPIATKQAFEADASVSGKITSATNNLNNDIFVLRFLFRLVGTDPIFSALPGLTCSYVRPSLAP